MQKSLVVQGKSLEDALDKGAVLLHCPKECVAYEIMQAPQPGRHGQPNVPCKLRVTPVAPAAEELNGMGPTEAEDERLPWQEWDLAAMPSRVFLLSLQNLSALVPRPLLFPDSEPLPARFPIPRLEITGDVGLSTGSLRHDGDVHISGSVRKGMTVQAAGSITVVGDVETATLEAGGDIVIVGGLLGVARSRVGSITCKFAQGARINAQGNVTVQESAMHAYIYAGRSIFVGDILLGGSCYGESLIEARIAGSEFETPTVLIAGRNKRLLEEIEAIRARAQKVVADMRDQDAVCCALLPREEEGISLPVEERIRLWRALMQKTRLNDALMQLAQQKSLLLGMINVERTARVCVIDRAYPKVKVVVDDLALDLKSVTQYATFTKDYDAGEIRVTPYT